MQKMALLLFRMGLLLIVMGIALRVLGFHQGQGFLQPPLAHGLTPRAFLLGGVACAVFSIAASAYEIAALIARQSQSVITDQKK